MPLTDRLQPPITGLGYLESADNELFERIRNSVSSPIHGAIRILDIGSGSIGSYFVNRYGRKFPNTEIIYLDFFLPFLEGLERPNKVCANGTQIPFHDESFEIAYAGYVIHNGVLKNHWHLKDESYRIAKEGHRVIKRGGLFIFTYVMGDDKQTLDNLSEIGFGELEHLQRINYEVIPADIYAARK